MTAAARARHLVLAARGDDAAVLVEPADGGARLPTVEGPRWRSVGAVAADVRTLLGEGARLLRVAGEAVVSSTLVERFVVVDAVPPPAGAAWLPLDEVGALEVPAGLRPTLDRWVEELRGAAVPSQRPPWARPGGATDLGVWAASEARLLGRVPGADARVVRQWAVSQVVRQPTDRGDVFAKAVGELFWHEPRITRALAARAPHDLPQVLATDDVRGRLLLDDAGTVAFDEVDEAGGERARAGVAAVRALARVQRAWAGGADELRRIGCPDRSPAALAAVLPGALERVATLAGPDARCTPQRHAALVARLPALGETLARLSASPVPPTVVHGDFHPGNVGVRADGTVCLLDWSDAAVGHPFVDLVLWFSHVSPELAAQQAAAYLDEWGDALGLDADAAARELADAEVAGLLHQLLTYDRLLRAVEVDERPALAVSYDHWAGRLLDLPHEARAPGPPVT